uniref:Uncharacterized protein n=1 Tax=Dunaliella tertiolecta TaxID=3047 RepID=A0A7S3QXN4_DUNTE
MCAVHTHTYFSTRNSYTPHTPPQHTQLEAAGGEHRIQRDRVEPAIAHVAAVGKELGLNKVTPAFIPGAFNGALTTDVRQIEQADDTTNLGRLTFNQFKPTDTKVQLGQFTGGSYAPRAETGLPDLYRGPFEGMPQGYCLFTHFRVVEDGKSPDDCLHGVMTAIAEYDVPGGDKPAAMTIKFRRLRLQPTPSVAQNQERLNHWLHLFKTHNPSMNDAGVGEVELPANGPVGTIEYLLMDENEQVHVGNMGSCMIMKRWSPPAGSLGAALVEACKQ